jgi:ABC-type multidrug transport system ATPase subunit
MTAPHEPTSLQVHGLGFSYRDRLVFHDWSMVFGSGLTWLQGANGSGKSTLLKLLAGALMPRSGRVSVKGIDAVERPLDYRREVFWCGPGPIAFDHLLAGEYFGFLRGLYPRFDVAALRAHVQAFGLEAHLNTPIRAMSTGTQRKVWLAAALVSHTAAVLLDEPLTALDAASLDYARRSLARLSVHGNQVWLVASHEPPCATEACSRIVTLP